MLLSSFQLGGKIIARQICWTKKIVETFIEEACLTKEEQDILRTNVAGLTISEQAEKFNISVCKVNRIIKRLKCKYDNVQNTVKIYHFAK